MIVNFFLSLPNYYFLIGIVQIIYIMLLKIKFELVLSSKNFNQLDDIMHINDAKVRSCLIYKHYIYCDLAFQKVSIYKYFQCIIIIK